MTRPQQELQPSRSSRSRRRRQPRPRTPYVAGVVIAIAAAVALRFAVIHPAASTSPSQASGALPTKGASYLGVFGTGTPDSYQSVTAFTRAAGRAPNLAGYYSGWDEPFKTGFAQQAQQHGAATIIQINPTLVSVADIATGSQDAYLHRFAAAVKAFGHPVVIGFGHEMNANWYSWGYGQASPAAFVAAWRHIVTLFRQQGVPNVTWMWTLQADEKGTGPVAAWWPGASYVTWVGIDGYYYRPTDTFFSVFGATVAQVRLFTAKPILLSEAAVGPAAGQATKIPGLFAGMRQYGTLGLVWFDIAQNDGVYHQDWHLEDNPAAVTAFRHAASGLTLAAP
ncbi:MAG TPA: glycosyl hydrolase [Streptosporangiaceae bacterium]